MDKDIEFICGLLFKNSAEKSLSDEDLMSLALSFPSILIANADGVIDKKERMFFASMAKSLSSDAPETERDLCFAELYHCMLNLADLDESEKSELLAILGKHARDDQELKSLLVEQMHGAAEASDGVSDSELAAMSSIASTVGLNLN